MATRRGVEVVEDFDAFVAARGPALWRTAWFLTGDHHRAEDLVQTALARSWRHFDRVDDFEAYVRRVMVNTYTSWWRRKWNGEEPRADAGREEVSHSTQPDVDLLRALAALPRAQRTVMVLRYFNQMSEREIAEQMRISTGTVKSHASRAIAALRVSPMITSGDEA